MSYPLNDLCSHFIYIKGGGGGNLFSIFIPQETSFHFSDLPHVLFFIQCSLFHNFTFLCSNNTFIQKPHAKI